MNSTPATANQTCGEANWVPIWPDRSCGDETRVTIAYNNPNLLPTSVTTAAGDGSVSSTVSYSYDARDRVLSVTQPDNQVTTPA